MVSRSFSGKSWIHKQYNPDHVNFLKENFFLDDFSSKFLASRNIAKENIETFLNPTIKSTLPNPFSLIDMEKAVARTILAIEKKENIGIFGDYDVDGASSTALLSKFFFSINLQNKFYIPDRNKEGYGPSKLGFDKLIGENCKLIFTVDCGTLSFDIIDYASKKQTDVIILDHHQSEMNLPKAYAIVNPNRLDESSSLNHLCAAGVTFMFLIALNAELKKNKFYEKNNLIEPNLLDYLDLVALGTICDVVSLTGINRAIVKQGLKIINKRKNLGLKTMLDLCKPISDITVRDVGYTIGPRINAGGRIGKSSDGAELLLSENPETAFRLAKDLNQYNLERQMLEKQLIEIVDTEAKKIKDDPILVLAGESWHEGVIGIIASRIKDKYNKPSIIISLKDNIGKASGRSVAGFDIGTLIIGAVQSGLLLKGGGHKMACGFSIEKDKINHFKEFTFKKYSQTKNSLNGGSILIDSEISSSAVNLDFFEKVDSLGPFGSGFPEPKFSIENLRIVKSMLIGDKHIKAILAGEDGSTFSAISFNSVDKDLGQFLLNKKGILFNVVGKLVVNEWNNNKKVEFIIDDISVNK